MSGHPLLLLHAGGMDRRMWEPMAALLDDRFDVLAPDLGAAPAREALAALDERGAERATIVGASFGGNVALQLATLAPERVAGLVLLAATLFDHDFSEDLKGFWAAEDALVEAGDIEGAVALGVRTWVREPAVAGLATEMFRAGLATDPGEPEMLPVDLDAVRAPTLAVSGGRDFGDFAAMADRIAATVPGARRAEVRDAGHLIALERPRAAADLVRDALRTGPNVRNEPL